MTSINPINVNTQGVGASVGFGAQAAKKEEHKEAELHKESAQTPVAADKVLDFLAANAAPVAAMTGKKVDPSKYVDEASAKRIAAFMGQFEEKVAQGLKAFDAEFAGIEISDSTKMAMVLKQVEKES